MEIYPRPVVTLGYVAKRSTHGDELINQELMMHSLTPVAISSPSDNCSTFITENYHSRPLSMNCCNSLTTTINIKIKH